jgi:hypothetical protein
MLAIPLPRLVLLTLALASSLPAQAPRPGLPALPVTTTSPVASSAAVDPQLHFDDQAADGSLWVLGTTYKANFDGRGFDYVPFLGSAAPRNFPLRVELLTATAGGQPLALRDGAPSRQRHRVATDRGPLTEVVDLALDQVEQSFVFATLPNRGAVAVEVRLSGEFEPAALTDGLRFANAHGAVDYRKAIAVDAAGNRLDLPIEWLGDRARIEIPASFAANATLPLVLDPLLSTIPLSGGLPAAQAQRNPDVARLGASGLTAVCWTVTFSAGDEDVLVQFRDAGQNLIGNTYVDFTSENWVTARIASNQNSARFLVVSQVDVVASWFVGSYIAGRLLDPLVLSPKVVIEGANLVGLPGSNFRPDVGGDPSASALAYYTVVFEHETAPGNHDIYYRQLDQNGTLRTTNPLPLDTSSTMQQHPAIGESNGPIAIGRALVAWQSQQQFPPFDDDVQARWLGWDGALLGSQFQVASSARNESRPAVSSYANVIGADVAAVAWEDDFGTDRDISVRLFDLNGTPLSTQLDLNALAAASAYLLRNQAFPAVETDGNRFAIGYSEFSGTDYDTYAATAVWLPATGSWRLDDERTPLSAAVGTDDYWTRIVADWNFTTTNPNSEYTIVSAAIGSNEIELHRYGGWLAGNFYTRFGSQCGSLGILPGGAPTTGSFATFDLSNAGPVSGFLFGTPGFLNPTPCLNCVVGVFQGVTVPGPSFSWYVPANPVFVNALTLSIQGWSFGGTACLGAIDLSDTIDFVIR